MDFAEGVILLAGDFNCVLDPMLDTSAGRSSISSSQITHLKKILGQYNLMDVWQLSLPTDRVYLFYSTAHSLYSRMDYFLVGNFALTFCPQSSLGIILWSDHIPFPTEPFLLGMDLEIK